MIMENVEEQVKIYIILMFSHGQCNNFKKKLLTIEMLFVRYRKTLLLFSRIPKNHLVAKK